MHRTTIAGLLLSCGAASFWACTDKSPPTAQAPFPPATPGVRMDGDRVFIDIRAALAPHGLTSILDYVKDVAVGTEDGRLVVAFAVGVRG